MSNTLAIRMGEVVLVLDEAENIGVFVNETKREALTMSADQAMTFIGAISMGFDFPTTMGIVASQGGLPQPISLSDEEMSKYHAMMASGRPLNETDTAPVPRVNTVGTADVN